MKQIHILMILLGLVLVTSGCMNSNSDQRDSPQTSNNVNQSDIDRTIEVAGGNYYFESENIEVEQGQTIEFVFRNEGGAHDMRIPDLGQGTSVISGGETERFVVTFDETGELEFICSVGSHAAQGMTGTITVS